MRWPSVPKPPDVPGPVRWTSSTARPRTRSGSRRPEVSHRTNVADEREFYASTSRPRSRRRSSWRVRAVRRSTGRSRHGLPAVSVRPVEPDLHGREPRDRRRRRRPARSPRPTRRQQRSRAGPAPADPGFAFTGNTARERHAGRALPRLRLQRHGLRQRHLPRLGRRLAGLRPAHDRAAEAAADHDGRDQGVAEHLKDSRRASRADAVHVRLGQGLEHRERSRAREAGGHAPQRAGTTPNARLRTTRRTRRPKRSVAARDPQSTALRSTSGTAAGRTGASTGRSCPCGTSRRAEADDGRGRERARSKQLPRRRRHRFRRDQLLRIGTGATQETLTIVSVDVATNSISTTTAAAYAHGTGEDVENLTATLDYWDLELPQDVCAAGRVQAFGKGSLPLVAARPRRTSRGSRPRAG